jgi:chemotaxis protein methyltransferase CheR
VALSLRAFSRRDYDRVRALVRDRSGLELRESGHPDLDRALLRASRASGAASAEELYALLSQEGGSPALQALLDALVVRESHFFRSRAQFDALAAHVLPDLIAKRCDSRRLRIWSAGCAAGEEPYSVAILLERLLPDIEDWQILILATDISVSALERARRGRYRPWSFREIPAEIERTYFVDCGQEREILPRIRERVTFARMNLVDERYPSVLSNTSRMDLVLCRNVLLYFGPRAAAEVRRRLHDAVTEGGWLMLGQAEAPPESPPGFEARRIGGAALYQKATGERPPPARARRTVHSPPARARVTRSAPQSGTHDRYREILSMWRAGRASEALARAQETAVSEPADGRWPLLAARILAEEGNFVESEHWARRALRCDADLAQASYLLGLILEETGRPAEALAALRQSAVTDPSFPLAHYALGGAFLRQGQRRRALKELETVARLLTGQDRARPVLEGDELTVGALADRTAEQIALLNPGP